MTVNPTLDPNGPQNGSWLYPAGSGVEIDISHLPAAGETESDSESESEVYDLTAGIYGEQWVGGDPIYWNTNENDL